MMRTLVAFWLFVVGTVAAFAAPVYMSFDPTTANTMTLSGNNLTATSGTPITSSDAMTNIGHSSGSYCFELKFTTITTNVALGVENATNNTDKVEPGDTVNAVGFYPVSPTQVVFFNGAQEGSGGAAASTNGEIATACIDLTNLLFWVTDSVMRNASQPWNNSATANPSTGTGGLPLTGLTCPCYAEFNSTDVGSVATINLTGPFAVALPTGFLPWQTDQGAFTILGVGL